MKGTHNFDTFFFSIIVHINKCLTKYFKLTQADLLQLSVNSLEIQFPHELYLAEQSYNISSHRVCEFLLTKINKWISCNILTLLKCSNIYLIFSNFSNSCDFVIKSPAMPFNSVEFLLRMLVCWLSLATKTRKFLLQFVSNFCTSMLNTSVIVQANLLYKKFNNKNNQF